MSKLTAYIDGIGLIGPGFNDWAGAAPALAGRTPFQLQPTAIPTPSVLPPAERRRCGPIVKLSLAVGHQAAAHAQLDVATLPTVFSASGGDGANCHAICDTLASADRQISPTRFHNSVHNAAAGYWGIAAGARVPSSVLCAFDGSFGAGLLEAMAQVQCDGIASMLVACDTPYPEPLHSARPIPHEFGVGLVLAPQAGARTIARIEVALAGDAPTVLADPALEQLRATIPAARCLPLLQAVAVGQTTRLVLDYLDGCSLTVECSPC